MSRRFVTVLLLSLGCVGCTKEGQPRDSQALDRQIPGPIRVPSPEEWRRVPNIRIRADSIEVVAASISPGRKVATDADLRRLLISLPRTDWPYGRQALCLPPSLSSPDEDLIQANIRRVLNLLRQLEIACVVVR